MPCFKTGETNMSRSVLWLLHFRLLRLCVPCRRVPYLRLMMLLLVALITALPPVPVFAATLHSSSARQLAQADEAEWLVMLYSDADDNVLEQDILFDLQEVELIGST